MTPLHKRIVEALRKCPDGHASYYQLIYDVWPRDQYPRAHRGSSNGGPPGVAMSFGRALREMQKEGIIRRPRREFGDYSQEDVYLVGKWKNDAVL